MHGSSSPQRKLENGQYVVGELSEAELETVIPFNMGADVDSTRLRELYLNQAPPERHELVHQLEKAGFQPQFSQHLHGVDMQNLIYNALFSDLPEALPSLPQGAPESKHSFLHLAQLDLKTVIEFAERNGAMTGWVLDAGWQPARLSVSTQTGRRGVLEPSFVGQTSCRRSFDFRRRLSQAG